VGGDHRTSVPMSPIAIRRSGAGRAKTIPTTSIACANRFNAGGDRIELLYLLCRCVKNAVRFNARDIHGIGRPNAVSACVPTNAVTRWRVHLRCSKAHRNAVRAIGRGAARRDAERFHLSRSTYHGTSTGRDRRYADGLPRETLIDGLHALNARRLRYAFPMTSSGERSYGPPYRRTQTYAASAACGAVEPGDAQRAAEETVEALYLTPGLAEQPAMQLHETQGVVVVLAIGQHQRIRVTSKRPRTGFADRTAVQLAVGGTIERVVARIFDPAIANTDDLQTPNRTVGNWIVVLSQSRPARTANSIRTLASFSGCSGTISSVGSNLRFERIGRAQLDARNLGLASVHCAVESGLAIGESQFFTALLDLHVLQ